MDQDSDPKPTHRAQPSVSLLNVSLGPSISSESGSESGSTTPTPFSLPDPLPSRRRQYFEDQSLQIVQMNQEIQEFKLLLTQMKNELEISKNRNEFLELQLVESDTSVGLLRSQIQNKNNRILQLLDENSKVKALEMENEELRKKLIEKEANLGFAQRQRQSSLSVEESLKQQISNLTDQLSMKEVELKGKDTMMTKMAEKLMDLKIQLQVMVPHLCKFNVSTVTRFTRSVVASIGVLKPNASKTSSDSNSARELEIVISGKRTTYLPSQVVSIAPVLNHAERFVVTYKNGSSDTFDSTRRQVVIKELNTHLFSTAPVDEPELAI